MRSVATKVLALSAVVFSLVVAGSAQQKPMDPNDPRTGLKPGLRDAGVAARGMELVSTRPRAEGFFDPKNPAGEVMPAERQAAIVVRANRAKTIRENGMCRTCQEYSKSGLGGRCRR